MEEQFNEITRARHYGTHPSGIEAKEICKHLGFYLGSAVKYLWRMHEKHEQPVQDVRKALFYLEEYADQMATGGLMPVTIPTKLWDGYLKLARQVIATETDGTAATVFALVLPAPHDLGAMRTAADVLRVALDRVDGIPYPPPLEVTDHAALKRAYLAAEEGLQ